MGKHKESTSNHDGESVAAHTVESTSKTTEPKHEHDIHESSDENFIYQTCRTCPDYAKKIPRDVNRSQ